MYIDYSKIVTKDLKLLISDEKLQTIKNEAEMERKFIWRNGLTEYVKNHFFNKADEVAYVSYRHKDKNSTEKAMLAANIVFEDEKFCEILLKGNYDLHTLETYITLLNYLKSKIANGEEEKIDEKYLKTAENLAKKLSKHFQMYVGKNNPNMIINKINEIISFKPELLNNQTNTHTK